MDNYELIQAFLHGVLIAGTPLLLAILGEIVTEKSGSLNLGVEGLMMIGAVTAFYFAYKLNSPILAIIMSLVTGMALSAIFAILTIFFNASQVVSGITLTIFGTALANFIGKNLEGSILSEQVKSYYASYKIPVLHKIPYIGNIIFNQPILVYIAWGLSIILAIYIYKTKWGTNLQAIGENPICSDTLGIKVNLYKYIHICIGGAICSFGGAFLSVVHIGSWLTNITGGKGWIAVVLVIFARWNPIYAIFVAYFFGGLEAVGFTFQSLGVQIPQYFTDVLPFLVTIIFIIIISIKNSKSTLSPKWLGVNYKK